MSNWIETLKAKIDAIKDEDWNDEHVVVPGKPSFRLKSVRIVVPTINAVAWSFFRFNGHVNSAPIAGISPEKLLIEGMETNPDDNGKVLLGLRNSVPWTHILSPDGKFRRFTDGAGQAIFRCADFNLILPPEDRSA